MMFDAEEEEALKVDNVFVADEDVEAGVKEGVEAGVDEAVDEAVDEDAAAVFPRRESLR